MEKDLSNYRRAYQKSELSENELSENPLELFQKWFFEVEEFGSDIEVNAMTVSTIGKDGFPKNRVVLLKKYIECFFYLLELIYKQKELGKVQKSFYHKQ